MNEQLTKRVLQIASQIMNSLYNAMLDILVSAFSFIALFIVGIIGILIHSVSSLINRYNSRRKHLNAPIIEQIQY